MNHKHTLKRKPVAQAGSLPYRRMSNPADSIIMESTDELSILHRKYKHAIGALKAITRMSHLPAVHAVVKNTLDILHES